MASAAGSLFARTLRRPHRRRSVHDRRLGRLSGSVRRRASSPARASTTWTRSCAALEGRVPGERAAVARPVRGALRAHRARHRRRGRRRLSRRACSRTRGASTAGCAATGRSCGGCFPFVPSPRGPAAQPPAAHRALEDPRQPAAQPDGAGDRGAARCSAGPSCPGSPVVWTAVGARARSPSRSCPRLLDAARAARAAAAVARVPARAVDDLDDRAARGRRCSSRSSPTRPTRWLHAIAVTLVRLGVTQRRLLEWETAAASAAPRRRRRGRGRLRRGDDREPVIAARRPRCWWRSLRPRRAAGGAAVRSRCGRPRRRSPSRSAGRCRPRRVELGAEDRAVPPSGRARDLALLRDVRGRRGSRAAARQRPGGARAARRAPHLADQHRHGRCSRRWPRTTSASSTPTSWSRGSTRRSRPSRASSASKAICSTGTTRETLAPLPPALRLDRRQRQPRRRAHDAAPVGAARRRQPRRTLAAARADALVRRR